MVFNVRSDREEAMTRMRHAVAALTATFALIAVAAQAQVPRKPAPETLVYFDNDFLGPGQSNIQALIPLLRDDHVSLIGIGVVTGDAWLKEETAHVLRFLEIAGRTDIPVLEGAEMPLLRNPREMAHWEGRYGRIVWKGAWNAPRAGRDYHPDDPALIPPMPEGAPETKPSGEDAVSFLIRAVRANPNQITIVTAGPLTNIALALRIAPEIAGLAREIVIEGGGLDTAVARVTGNTDYATDFNFIFDPEAAHIVLTSPWKRITLLGNVTGSAKVTPEIADKIGAAATPVAQYFQTYARRGQPMWDEITAAVATDRTLVTSELIARMDVDLLPGPSYGQAQIWKDDLAPNNGEREVHIVQSIDVKRFLDRFVEQATR
jgi:inosine-uridine nucleoside N-ribohydrolase